MNLTIGFSSCPNDTFMFDAMIHHKIDTEGLKFDVVMTDIQKLNMMALEGKLNVTKLSFNAFTYCIDDYLILDSGAALGKNCGPILIKKSDTVLSENSKIAIPGKFTTANMLLDIALPKFKNKEEILFSNIEDDILKNKVDGGVIIHENRFTYQDKGLMKVIDLGEFWQKETKLPIPLGGIVVKRNVSSRIQKKIERVISRSVEYALKNPDCSSSYVKYHAQEMDKLVIKSHINLYVNKYSISLGADGRDAVMEIFNRKKRDYDSIFV